MTVAATREPTLGSPAPFRFPIASAQQLAAMVPGHDNVFCADQQGGYLIWTLYPRFRPYIDTRLGLRSADQLREYLRLADAPQGFDAFAQKHDLAYVVLPIAYPDRYLGLITYLYHNPNWQLIFTDGSEILFARRDAAVRGGTESDWNLAHQATTNRILAMIDANYSADTKLHDAALVQFATLQVAVNEFAQAQRVLARSSSAAGAALRARALLAAGDLDAAQELGEERAKLERDDVRNLVLLAMIYGRRGRLQPCLHYLRRALALDPLDGEALGLLATLEEQQHAH